MRIVWGWRDNQAVREKIGRLRGREQRVKFRNEKGGGGGEVESAGLSHKLYTTILLL